MVSTALQWPWAEVRIAMGRFESHLLTWRSNTRSAPRKHFLCGYRARSDRAQRLWRTATLDYGGGVEGASLAPSVLRTLDYSAVPF